MSEARVPLVDAARRLGVTRRRVQALIEAGALPAERMGSQWVVPASSLRLYENNKPARRGRPLKADSAWSALRNASDAPPRSKRLLDELRREVRPRADHIGMYVHRALLNDVAARPGVVVSGRAAVADSFPVDPVGDLDVYVRSSEAADLIDDVKAGPVASGANLRLHIVDDNVWPFRHDQRYADLWVAWLDLADQRDRAADVVLDRLLGGRLVAA